MTTFTPETFPVAGSALLSALTALLPLAVFFILLIVAKLKTHISALVALVVAVIIAVVAFHMPLKLSLLSATQGMAFAFAPILSIIIAAVWLYNLSEESGRAQDIKAVFDAVGKGDRRAQAFLMAFGFCGLLEGLAGFGSPVVIVGAMLVSINIPPLKAALAAIMGNVISLGFGAMGIPVTTGAKLGETSGHEVAVAMGYVAPYLVLVIPLSILIILDGKRGVRDLWPLALVAGVVSAINYWWCSMFFTYELTIVVSSLIGFIAVAALLQVWHPSTPDEWVSMREETPTISRAVLALMPYWLVVIIFAIAKLWTIGIDVPKLIAKTDLYFPWPGLHGHILNPDGSVSTTTIFTLHTLSAPATLIAITACIVTLVYSLTSSGGKFPFTIKDGFFALIDTIIQRKILFLTIATIIAVAYVMNFSGQTVAIGQFLAEAGVGFAFVSPLLGWIGTAGTGSATSSNALFAHLQATAAHTVGTDPNLFIGANTIAGEIGKAISPQNLAIAAGAIDHKEHESTILRHIFPWSFGLLVALTILTVLASFGMLPGF